MSSGSSCSARWCRSPSISPKRPRPPRPGSFLRSLRCWSSPAACSCGQPFFSPATSPPGARRNTSAWLAATARRTPDQERPVGEVPGIVERHAGAAIAALEALLQGGAPTATDHLAEAVQELIRMRDGLIRELRAGRDCGQWLRQANSILSSILGTEFPIDGLQWN